MMLRVVMELALGSGLNMLRLRGRSYLHNTRHRRRCTH
jgi:hypothetical protein